VNILLDGIVCLFWLCAGFLKLHAPSILIFGIQHWNLTLLIRMVYKLALHIQGNDQLRV
jgi:hypothetical protein